jgi:ferredoxin
MRDTDKEACTGCGACLEICPVQALRLEGDLPFVDEDWCIGCGVCATVCPSDAVVIKVREDREGTTPAFNFTELHRRIRKEKGLD